MVRQRTSSICLTQKRPVCFNAKETRVSDDLIFQTTANELRMRKRDSMEVHCKMKETRLVDNPKVGNCHKFAMAKENGSSNSSVEGYGSCKGKETIQQ